MKLDAVDAELAVADAHDLARVTFPLSPRSDFQAVGQGFLRSDQAVISGCLAGRFDSREDSSPVVQDGRDFSVHQSLVTNNFCAVDFGDALMSQANAQHRNLRPEFFDDCS